MIFQYQKRIKVFSEIAILFSLNETEKTFTQIQKQIMLSKPVLSRRLRMLEFKSLVRKINERLYHSNLTDKEKEIVKLAYEKIISLEENKKEIIEKCNSFLNGNMII